jgi:hypothetical protein
MAVQEQFTARRQHTLTEIQAGSPPPPARPGRVCCEDERRVGLLPVQRRGMTLRGIQPVGTVQDRFENFDVYGACRTHNR